MIQNKKERVRGPIPENLAKLLVFIYDDQYLAYELGKFNIYLERVRKIQTDPNEHIIPKMAIIRYEHDADIYNFIDNSHVQAERIFKSAIFPHGKIKFRSFFYASAKNLLALLHGKTIRIKSKNSDLQKEFYAICEEINKEQNFQCKFDFDEFDAFVEVREYKTPTKHWLVLLTRGLDKLIEAK